MNLKSNGKPKEPPPHNIKMFKGYKNVALTRKTAHFVIHHPIVKQFRNWLVDTLIPDESFYATLTRIIRFDPESKKAIMDTERDTLGTVVQITLF